MLMICLFLSIWVFWLFVILGLLMGFKARRAVDDDVVFLTVPVPGFVKNSLLDLCEVSGVSFQRLVGMLLVNGLRDAAEVPKFELGGVVDSFGGVSAYLRGERRLEPCGQVSCDKKPVDVLGFSFCDVCGVCLKV